RDRSKTDGPHERQECSTLNNPERCARSLPPGQRPDEVPGRSSSYPRAAPHGLGIFHSDASYPNTMAGVNPATWVGGFLVSHCKTLADRRLCWLSAVISISCSHTTSIEQSRNSFEN